MKILLLFIALLAFPCISAESVEARSKFELGVKGGVNFATLELDYLEDSRSRSVFGGGLFLRCNGSGFSSFQLELLYMRKGTEHTVPSYIYRPDPPRVLQVEAEYSYEMDFFEIPVLVMIRPLSIGRFSPYIYAGQALSVRLRAERDSVKTGAEDNVTYYEMGTQDIGDATTTLDFQILLGAGTDVAFGGGSLVFDVRFTYGLHDLEEGYIWRHTGDPDPEARSRVFSITAGYSFPIGGR